MTYEQFIAGREHDVIPEREVWDTAQAAERKRIVALLRANQYSDGLCDADEVIAAIRAEGTPTCKS